MPDLSAWNAANTVQINNCYNFATDNLNRPGQNKPPAQPGRKMDITAGKIADVTIDLNGNVGILFDYTCKGVKTACLADGLHEPNADGGCNANCWKIAYYVRRWNQQRPDIDGSFHFARQMPDGSWAHKAGTYPATDKQYNPTSRKFDGPPITDPAKDNVGPLYEFCGYLCCCQGTVVAMSQRPRTGETLVTVAPDQTLLAYAIGKPTPARAHAAYRARTAKIRWEPGWATEPSSVRIELPAAQAGSGRPATTLFIGPRSLTELTGNAARHAANPTARLLHGLRKALGAPGLQAAIKRRR